MLEIENNKLLLTIKIRHFTNYYLFIIKLKIKIVILFIIYKRILNITISIYQYILDNYS